MPYEIITANPYADEPTAWDDSGEGPWDTPEQATDFAYAEIPFPWIVRQTGSHVPLAYGECARILWTAFPPTMRPTTRFATPEADEMIGSDDRREHGPDDNLENYCSPDQTEEVFCTTDQREDFERETERALTADVIEDQDDYDIFVRYLVENCDLRQI